MATIQGFNVGTDVSFVVTDNFGDVFMDASLGYLEDFSTQAKARPLQVMPITLGGKPVNQTIWQGGSGRLTYTRFGPSFQQMFMDLQNAYYGTGLIPQFTMNVGVRNRDGSIDSYVYDGMQFSDPHFGDFRSTKEVSLQVGFEWSSCQASGALTAFLAALG